MPKVSRANIDEVRRFNRAYTRTLGVLDEGFLETPYSLTEARVLHELSEGEQTASEIASKLGLDAGYLSRLLRRFKDRGLIRTARADADARHQHLTLTAAGKRAFDDATLVVVRHSGIG